MITFLTAAQTAAALPYPTLVDALRTIYKEQVQAPPRHVHQLLAKTTPNGPTTLLLMPAWQPNANLGVKLVTVAAGNGVRNLPSVHSIYLLFDTATGVPLAMLDGEELTQRRTAAASALAAAYLARPDAATLLIIGTGRLAPFLAAAHCTIRPLRRVLVWGRSTQRAQALVDRLRHRGLGNGVTVDIAHDLASAVGCSDIISCATTSTTPIVQGAWVSPGTHVDLVGGFRPDMREADDALMTTASLFVDTFAGALTEAGDLVQPMTAGLLDRAAIRAELADLCSGQHPGRSGRAEITVFKSVGSAIQDLCAANVVWAAHLAGAAVAPVVTPEISV